MQVLASNAGAAGEQIALLTQQGDAFPATLTPASSLATATPLSSVLYVDGASTATGVPNGSQLNPFHTVQAAVDASIDQGTIYVCWTPAGYAEAVNCGVKQLQIVGIWSPNQSNVGSVAVQSLISSVNLVLQNLVVSGAISAVGSDLNLIDVEADGPVSCFNLKATARLNTTSDGSVSASGEVNLVNYSWSGPITCQAFNASSVNPPDHNACALTAAVTATGGPLSVQNMQLTANLTGDFCTLNGCLITANLTVTAAGNSGTPILKLLNTTKSDPTLVVNYTATQEGNTADIDFLSHQYNGPDNLTTFGVVRILGALAKETISVVVPAVAAGNVGYADVTAVADLRGITTADVVDGNATADLVAAGAGGGYINCRVSANNTIRCAFVGPLAGGASNFQFVRLTRSALP